MGNLLFFIIFIAVNVSMYLSQDAEDIQDFEDITEANVTDEETPFTYNDQTALFPENVCYSAHSKCHKVNTRKDDKEKEVCAHQKEYRLVNFGSPCEIALQNCLFRVHEEKTGVKVADLFFYNGQEKPCQYYLQKGKTIEEAVYLYRVDELKDNKLSKEFEKIDKNHKYDLVDLVTQ